jgi:hypothetical protein
MTDDAHKSEVDTSTWPKGLREIADLIGPELALKVAEEFGGATLTYFPKRAKPSHAWAKLIGMEAWTILCNAMGGYRMFVPRGVFISPKKIQILELGAQGLTHNQIALRVKASARYVQEVLKTGGVSSTRVRRHQADPRNLKLPFVPVVALALSLARPAVAQDDTALVMARCVAAEVGVDLPAGHHQAALRTQEQVTILWSLHNWWRVRRAREPGLTLAEQARRYCRIYRDRAMQRRRPWILELPGDGDDTQPASWPRHLKWESYAPRWQATLRRVREWLGPCEGPEHITHWNDPSSAPHGRLRRAACDGVFAEAGRTRFYTLGAP